MADLTTAPGPAGPNRGPGTWESAALLASGTGAGSALLLRALVEAVRYRYVGRETVLRSAGAEVRLVPTAVAASLGARALTTGRLDEVRLSARDVVRPALRLRELTVAASDVRLRLALVPELVAGPVAVSAVLDPAWVAGRLREHLPGVEAAIDADGVPRVRWRTRPNLGAAELGLAVDGHTLSWRVTGLTVAGRRIGPRSGGAPRSARAVLGRGPLRGRRSGAVRLVGLPTELRLTGLEIAPGAITVRGTVASWRRAIPPARIDDVLRGALSLLDLGR